MHHLRRRILLCELLIKSDAGGDDSQHGHPADPLGNTISGGWIFCSINGGEAAGEIGSDTYRQNDLANWPCFWEVSSNITN